MALGLLAKGVTYMLRLTSDGAPALLAGGDKRKQSSDIARAAAYLKDYKERTSKV